MNPTRENITCLPVGPVAGAASSCRTSDRAAPLPKAIRLLVAGVMLACTAVGSTAFAAAPQVRAQAPGYFRLLLGACEVTALYDTGFKLETSLLHGTSPEQVQTLLSQAFITASHAPATLSAYLINTGRNLVLVDSGCGFLFKPSVSRLVEHLRAAGYEPAQIDTIVLTHLHGDHVAGLIDESDGRVFPNAKVYASQADCGFWLSAERAKAAPDAAKHFFVIAQRSVAPYVASGQWQSFSGECEIVPGIRAVAAHGHTPGHTAYRVDSEGQTLLLWGDLIHAPSVQFYAPEVTMGFDTSQPQAAITRGKLLQMAADQGCLVAGMHLDFPGIGRVRADGGGKFSFVPVQWRLLSENEQYVAGRPPETPALEADRPMALR